MFHISIGGLGGLFGGD